MKKVVVIGLWLAFASSCLRHPGISVETLRKKALTESIRFVSDDFGGNAEIEVSKAPEVGRMYPDGRWKVEIPLRGGYRGESWRLVLLLDGSGTDVQEAAYRVERELFSGNDLSIFERK